jgi:molybdopterin-biosynthesis enzyme MoeA-like protein
MVKRDREIGLKLTQDEYEHISRMAENDADTRWKSGKKNLSAYIRKCVLQSTGYRREGQIKKELDRLTYQIRKIGVNVNQATKKINSNFYDVEITERLHDEVKEVNRNLREFMDRLEEMNGSNEVDEH